VSQKPVALERWPELVRVLARRGWTATEINDWLWLAQTLAADLPKTQRGESNAPRRSLPKRSEIEAETAQQTAASSASSPPLNTPSPAPPRAPEEALLAPLTAENSANRSAPRVGVADSALLRRPRQLGRALAPLNRWHEEGPACVLDVAVTVEAIASARSEGLAWQPCLRPRRQPWLELQLVFDGSPSMALWQRLRRELPRLLAREVRWRDLRCWQLLIGANGTVTLADLRGRPCAPRRLRQRSDRSLVLVVSDAVAPAWYQGAMPKLLQGWASVQPVALLELLPQRLWLRTALAEQPAGWIRSTTPMRPHGQLAWQPVEGGLPEAAPGGAAPWLTLPVLQLQPEFLGAWARLLVGSRQGSALAYRFALPPPGSSQPSAAAEAEAPNTEDLLAVFLFTASAQARKLLALLTFAPVITLPIVRLVHGRMLEPLGAEAVAEQAEVLFSGLFAPATAASAKPIPADQQLLTFVDDQLLPRLREGLMIWEARAVFDRVQEFVQQSLNLSQVQFEALLLAPELCEGHPDQPLLRAFATAAPSRLRGLGGHYEALAKDLEQRWLQVQPGELVAIETWLDGLEEVQAVFDTAQLVEVPPLEQVLVETAWFKELNLEPLKFTTATIKPSAGVRFRAIGETFRDPSIDDSEGSAWCFFEPLGDSRDATAQPLPQLTLVEIQAGTFQMGSPHNEPERSAVEGLQHKVTLQSFFISQTPITQAQWRQVAEWSKQPAEHWGHSLKPNPSRFIDQPESDQRPVEHVSWHDAMEFCRRLSQRIGRQYTLPSEAQWEYACRAGSITPFHFGPTITPALANYYGNTAYANGSQGRYRRQTTPVQQCYANAWGLHDMHGNVWEWCLDHWHDSYEGAPADGSAWLNTIEPNKKSTSKKRNYSDTEEENRLLRGGSWNSYPGDCRSANRNHLQPDVADLDVGFRVVCLPQASSLKP
jgi:formylglycine-generating enzyme required for sulfatase activity